MFLPDVNFWLALAFESHQHHASANQWMRGAATHGCLFCRVTQMAFLRLATNPKVLPDDVLTLAQAWNTYDGICADTRVAFAEEPVGVETAWRDLTRSNDLSANLWTDAYLAAFAKTIDFEVVTFDKGFAQFSDLKRTILS